MTTIEAPALYERIEAPAVSPYRFGLFSVAEFGSNQREAFHATWESDTCRSVGLTQSSCVDVDTVPLEVNSGCEIGTADPFTVFTYYRESMAGSDLAWHTERARSQFLLAEQYGAEAGVASRLIADAGAAFDASTLATVYPNESVAALALAYVEAELADSLGGVTGIIHMTRFAAALLADVLYPDGKLLRTRLGTPVVAGGGYTAAFGAAADTTIVGSGPMVTLRAPMDSYASVDQATNDASVVVERPYVIGWDCTPVAATLTT